MEVLKLLFEGPYKEPRGKLYHRVRVSALCAMCQFYSASVWNGCRKRIEWMEARHFCLGAATPRRKEKHCKK